MSIVMDWNSDVKRYVQICSDGIPEADRPRVCPYCTETVMLHRHGRFFRCVFSLAERFIIPIFRFRCPQCGKTTSVLPAFLLPKQQTAVDIQEEVVRGETDGASRQTMAQRSAAWPGGPWSVRTIRRWCRRWNDRLSRLEDRLAVWLLSRYPQMALPRKRASGWSLWFACWERLRQSAQEGTLLYRLNRLARPLSLTVPGR